MNACDDRAHYLWITRASSDDLFMILNTIQ